MWDGDPTHLLHFAVRLGAPAATSARLCDLGRFLVSAEVELDAPIPSYLAELCGVSVGRLAYYAQAHVAGLIRSGNPDTRRLPVGHVEGLLHAAPPVPDARRLEAAAANWETSRFFEASAAALLAAVTGLPEAAVLEAARALPDAAAQSLDSFLLAIAAPQTLAVMTHAPELIKEYLLTVVAGLITGSRPVNAALDNVPFPHESLFVPSDAYSLWHVAHHPRFPSLDGLLLEGAGVLDLLNQEDCNALLLKHGLRWAPLREAQNFKSSLAVVIVAAQQALTLKRPAAFAASPVNVHATLSALLGEPVPPAHFRCACGADVPAAGTVKHLSSPEHCEMTLVLASTRASLHSELPACGQYTDF